MELPDPAARLRHDIANPLAALLAEVQLMLMDAGHLDAGTVTGLREIERLALRMRDVMHQSRLPDN